MRARLALLPVLAAVSLIGVQCSSNSNDDGANAGGSGAGQGGVGGAARGGAAGKGGVGGKGGIGGKGGGAFGGATAAGMGGAAAGEGGSLAEGGQSPLAEAGHGGSAAAGFGGTLASGGTLGSGGTGGSSGGSGGAAGTGGAATVPPIAHFGQLRFVNLAPSSVPLDFCVKKTGAANYPSTPILQSKGVDAGVPYQSQSAYVDAPISAPPDSYDFVIVDGSATTCDPPLEGAFGGVSFNPASSTTIAIFQSYFTFSGDYSAAVFTDAQGQAPHTGNVRLFYAANLLSSAVDFHALRTGITDVTWYSSFGPGFASAFHSTAVGTYEFRAMKAGTQTVLADKSGTLVAADDPFDIFLYQTETAKQTLLGCSSRPEAAIAACAR